MWLPTASSGTPSSAWKRSCHRAARRTARESPQSASSINRAGRCALLKSSILMHICRRFRCTRTLTSGLGSYSMVQGRRCAQFHSTIVPTSSQSAAFLALTLRHHRITHGSANYSMGANQHSGRLLRYRGRQSSIGNRSFVCFRSSHRATNPKPSLEVPLRTSALSPWAWPPRHEPPLSHHPTAPGAHASQLPHQTAREL